MAEAARGGTLERCNMLWIGPRLGPIERACIASVLRQGHRLSLYCYEPLSNVPTGVDVEDAAAILPAARIVRHSTGSVALFADLFRYELARRGKGIWVDSDVYLLAPIRLRDGYALGLQEPEMIGTGVLRLPAESPLLPPLLALFEEREVPPWLALRPRLAAHVRLALTGRTGLARMPWGTAGPHALTSLARAIGIGEHADPPAVHSPVHWRDAAWIRDPAERLEDRIRPETISLHLWNECIRGFKDAPAPAGSFLARLQREGAEA